MDIYGGKDPRDMPAYPLVDAARYLGLSVPRLRSWTMSRGRWGAVVRLPRGSAALSFTNLVEAHVLASMRLDRRIPLQRVRVAVRYVEDRLGVLRPLARQEFQAHGAELFVRHLGELHCVTKPGQLAMRALLDAYLQRIERDEDGMAARLFLFARSRKDVPQPRIVLVDPRVAWGRPIVAPIGVPVEIVAGRCKAGEPPAEVAADYGCSLEVVIEAMLWEMREAA